MTAFALAALCLAASVSRADSDREGFALFSPEGAAGIHFSDTDHRVVAIAARDLAADIERVSGKKPAVTALPASFQPPALSPPAFSPSAVLIGTLGRSPLIDALVSSGKLAAAGIAPLRGQWETFLIAVVDDPFPGSVIKRALVIAGSDRRGTAFGVYELSQMIGVSPWHWWADVEPSPKTEYTLPAGARVFGPPSVKYRGIFINDEDWGLQPWAAKTFEPEHGGIGPKTYARVFELLLRLKANTLWPAMHKCSPAFNSNPASAALADDYAIVMGSSHAEPMLRNNVTEWTAPAADYNYAANRDGVLRYWDGRVAANARYENIYTLGMRGIHDSGMVGPKTDAERIAALEQIFADQRALLARHIPDTAVERIPQMFCAYKEVLGLYRQGLRVPDDVTIMFPDDNFGYIRNLPGPAAAGGQVTSDKLQVTRKDSAETDGIASGDTNAAPPLASEIPHSEIRIPHSEIPHSEHPGGFGIYYHISYLGRPLSYLWLCTTPPALIWEEMSKAHAHGADRIWIVNVGDIKPAEACAEFFLQMAWDIRRWRRDNLDQFLPEWAEREFDAGVAPDIARVMEMYYQFNFERKPEHLQWWLPREKPRPSDFAPADLDRRRAAALTMQELLAGLRHRIPARKQDAFYQLVDYPVQGSILASKRYLAGEEAALKSLGGDDGALQKLGYLGDVLNLQLARLTRRYNTQIAGGKWNHLMQLEPADADWKSMRIAPWRVPAFQIPLPARPADPVAGPLTARAAPGAASRWSPVSGLGRSGAARVIEPATAAAIPLDRAATDSPALLYDLPAGLETRAASQPLFLRIHILPAHAIDGGGRLRLAVSIDDAPPQLLTLDVDDGGPAWAQGVLANRRAFSVPLPATARVIRLHGVDASVIVDQVTVER
ncbi:MAG: glycosyl hydrolase 115 family protein [Opitutaceae bacterium]|nr:glycosyl hydrolase 115 family protein [Opitutaceae bacterium]